MLTLGRLMATVGCLKPPGPPLPPLIALKLAVGRLMLTLGRLILTFGRLMATRPPVIFLFDPFSETFIAEPFAAGAFAAGTFAEPELFIFLC